MSRYRSFRGTFKLRQLPGDVRRHTADLNRAQRQLDDSGDGFPWGVAALCGAVILGIVLLAVVVELLGG